MSKTNRKGSMSKMLAALGMGSIENTMEMPKSTVTYAHGKQSTWKTHREGGVCSVKCFYCKPFSETRAR